MSMVVQNNHADVINIHNVNNIDDGTLNNHRKQKSRSRSTSPRKNNSRPNSPTNAMKRQIVYDSVNDGHIEAHVQESAILSSKKNNTDTATTATSASAGNVISDHQKAADQNNTPFGTDNALPHAHSARRKALLYRDNIPVNTKDVTIHNTTHDCGIGSKGPIVKQMVNNSIKPVATLSKWVNMLHSGTVHNLYTSLNTNAMYDTNQQWDAQGNVPYTKNTLSTDYRIQANKLRRPQSASNVPVRHQHSDSTNSESTVYGILQPTMLQPDHADGAHITPNTTHTAVHSIVPNAGDIRYIALIIAFLLVFSASSLCCGNVVPKDAIFSHTFFFLFFISPVQRFCIIANSYASAGKIRPSSAGPIPYKSAPQNRYFDCGKET